MTPAFRNLFVWLVNERRRSTKAPPRGFGGAFVLVSVAAAGLLATGCAPRIHYDVDFDSERGEVAVTMQVRGTPRDSLVLRGYGASKAMRLSSVEVRAPGSAGFRVDSSYSSGVLSPRIVVRGPLPSDVVVSWRVSPGAREGDDHVGYTGRSFGEISERSAFVAGRDVFLAPSHFGSGRIRVKFRAPRGWSIASPWERTEDGWRPGLRRRGGLVDLIQSPVAAGEFREREIRVRGTTLRCAFDASLARADEEQVAAAMEKVLRYVREATGRDLGHRYRVLVLGETADGDEIAGTGSVTGQGGTMVPLTASRLHAFAARLVDAWIAMPPDRVSPAGADERWVIEGLRELLAWRAVARAGFADDAQVGRDLAAEYAEMVTLDEAPNLARLDPARDEGARTTAAVALLTLEHELQSSKGRDPVTIESIARSVLGTPGGTGLALGLGFRARSVWGAASGRDSTMKAFRAAHVRDTAPLPVEKLFDFATTTPDPHPARGAVEQSIALAFTGNTAGYLENCGCKASQAGGVARRATALARVRAAGHPILVLDAGSAFPEIRAQFPGDSLARAEQKLYLETMASLGYDAVAVGVNELAQGRDRFRETAQAGDLPWLAANTGGEHRLALPWQVLNMGSVRVAVIGVLDPPRGALVEPAFERGSAGIAIEDPVETVSHELPRMRARADLVLVLGRLDPGTIRRLVERCPDVDIVVSSFDRAVSRESVDEADPSEPPGFDEGDSPGFIGRTLVLYATLDSFGLGSAVLGLDAQKRIASANVTATWLDESVPEDRAVRNRLTAFYARVGSSPAAIAGVHAPFEADAYRQTGAYAGGAKCATCHTSQAEQWRTTGHAHAWKTLLDVHRHFQPRCVSCHVVQFGAPTGFKMSAPDTALVNVQCEVCHGPGAAHAAAPSRENIRKTVPKEVCLACHTPDHSDNFVYEQRLPRVMHTKSGTR